MPHRPTIAILAAAGVCAVAGGAARAAAPADVPHPFVLWTKAEAGAIRKRMQTEPWMRRQLAAMEAVRGQGDGRPILDLFRYQVLGDEKAGKAQRDYLLSFVGAPVQSIRHSDQYLTALRYDVLYDTLTPEQRAGLEKTFRAHVQHELDHPYVNNRLSLLPNMQLPRMFSAHLLAVALRDEKLIRRIWSAPSGFRWFFGEYLADGGLYFEEFAKMYSLIGEMLLFCRGVERLGLDELGYGFVGPSTSSGHPGASMRRYVESLIRLGWPRTDIPGGMGAWCRVSMGDTRGGGLFQHTNVPGCLPDSNSGGDARGYRPFFAANMNGRDHRDAKVDKLNLPQWFEILAAKYADSPFAYFLAQMRERGEDRYYPSPFWGLGPIDPAAVKPPPAPSRLFGQRGFTVLHADETPAYWTSPAPAVALQFATLYVHYTSDCFSLLGYHAFNRPIYVNRAISAGYNGGPWDFHVRGHCGVVVDSLQAQPVGEVPTRHDFAGPARFLWARGVMLHPDRPYKGRGEVRSSDQPKTPATEIYGGVDLARALVLTREYLFDVYTLRSDRPRVYDWLVHAPGQMASAEPAVLTSTTDLNKTLLKLPEVKVDMQRRLHCGAGPFSLVLLQTCALADPAKSALGKAWYDRKIGVRLRMLGEEGTSVFIFDTPVCYTPGSPRAPRDGVAPARPEWGGVSVAVERHKPATTFVALHEPFEKGQPRIAEFRRVAQTAEGVAVAVVGAGGSGIDDRVMVRMAGDANTPVTLGERGGENFTFRTFAYVRVGKDTVVCQGDLTAMRVRAAGAPRLVLNGRPAPARVDGGVLVFGP